MKKPREPRTIEADRIVAYESIELRDPDDSPATPKQRFVIERYAMGIAVRVISPPGADANRNRIEFFAGKLDGTTESTTPVLTLSAGGGGQFVEFRGRNDSGCLNFKLLHDGSCQLVSDGNVLDLNISPQGKLLIRGVEFDEAVRRVVLSMS